VHDLIINKYRYLEDEHGAYLEVKASETSFCCDIDTVGLIDRYYWTIRPKYNYVVGKKNGAGIVLHRAIFPGLASRVKVSFVDGDHLNCRRYNLITKH
jgi:hypothetical protein